jgi:myo-inositol catabolism protein IolC
VGRTVFWDPLVGWLAKKATREETVAEIARRFCEFVDIFAKSCASQVRSEAMSKAMP